MPHFRIQIDASNLLIEVEGKIAKHGFITHRFVEAGNPDDAIDQAVAMIREDDDLAALIKNADDDPPIIDVAEVAEVETSDVDVQPGRVWYEEKPKKWWQFWSS
jgi:hypothetical protein